MISATVYLSHSLEGPFVIAHRSTTRHPRKSIEEEVAELSQKVPAMRLHAMNANWYESNLVFMPRKTIRIHDNRGGVSPPRDDLYVNEESDRRKNEESDRRENEESIRRKNEESDRRENEESIRRKNEESDRRKNEESDRRKNEESDRRENEESIRRENEESIRREGGLHWIDMPFDRSLCYQDVADFLQRTWCTLRNVQFFSRVGTRLPTHRVGKRDSITLTSGYTIVIQSTDTIRVRPCETLRIKSF